ncbi:MAG: hypothetical protein ACOWWM_17250 [Desulfobacterales bacterium]
MIYDLEQRLERLEKGLKKAEASLEKKGFQEYIKRKFRRFFDELSIKEWLIAIVALYLIVVVGVLISKGMS